MGKKKNKSASFAEEEMAAYAKAEPDIHEDRSRHILRFIKKHHEELRKTAMKYQNREDIDLYSKYMEAVVAFDNLEEDLRLEGFTI